MLVGTDNAAIQEQPFQVRVLQFLKDPVPNSFAGPAIEASPHRVPIAEPLGKITPRRTGLPDPKDCVHEQSIVGCRDPGITFLASQEIPDALPMFIRYSMATKHSGPSLAREKRTRSLPTSPKYCPHGLGRTGLFLRLKRLQLAPPLRRFGRVVLGVIE